MLTPSMTIRAALNALGAGQAAATPQTMHAFLGDPAAVLSAADASVANMSPGERAEYRAGDLRSAAMRLSRLIDARAAPSEQPLFESFRKELDPPERVARSFTELARPKPFDPQAAAASYLARLADVVGYAIPLRAEHGASFFARRAYYDFRKDAYAYAPIVERRQAHRRLLAPKLSPNRFSSPKYALLRRCEDGALVFVVSAHDIEHPHLMRWAFTTREGEAFIDGALALVAAGYAHASGHDMTLRIDGESGNFPTRDTCIVDKGNLPHASVERFADDAGLITAAAALAFGFPEFRVGLFDAFDGE